MKNPDHLQHPLSPQWMNCHRNQVITLFLTGVNFLHLPVEAWLLPLYSRISFHFQGNFITRNSQVYVGGVGAWIHIAKMEGDRVHGKVEVGQNIRTS